MLRGRAVGARFARARQRRAGQGPPHARVAARRVPPLFFIASTAGHADGERGAGWSDGRLGIGTSAPQMRRRFKGQACHIGAKLPRAFSRRHAPRCVVGRNHAQAGGSRHDAAAQRVLEWLVRAEVMQTHCRCRQHISYCGGQYFSHCGPHFRYCRQCFSYCRQRFSYCRQHFSYCEQHCSYLTGDAAQAECRCRRGVWCAIDMCIHTADSIFPPTAGNILAIIRWHRSTRLLIFLVFFSPWRCATRLSWRQDFGCQRQPFFFTIPGR